MRVEGNTIGEFDLAAVLTIANDRVPCCGKLYANLMFATRIECDPQQRSVISARDGLVAQSSKLAAGDFAIMTNHPRLRIVLDNVGLQCSVGWL